MTKKHIKITGSSEISWKDAIIQTINEVSKSIDYINEIKVLEQTAKISENKIIQYFVVLDLSFIVDTGRKD